MKSRIKNGVMYKRTKLDETWKFEQQDLASYDVVIFIVIFRKPIQIQITIMIMEYL